MIDDGQTTLKVDGFSQPGSSGPDLVALRDLFDRHHIMLCFNGPVTAALIEEIGQALRKHMEGGEETTSTVSDVFSVYIEMTQNIRRYAQLHSDVGLERASILVSRDQEGHHIVSAGNQVYTPDGENLIRRIEELATMDKQALKAAFKAQLRQPRSELAGSAGLGLIDMARKASRPIEGELRKLDERYSYFSLRVVL